MYKLYFLGVWKCTKICRGHLKWDGGSNCFPFVCATSTFCFIVIPIFGLSIHSTCKSYSLSHISDITTTKRDWVGGWRTHSPPTESENQKETPSKWDLWASHFISQGHLVIQNIGQSSSSKRLRFKTLKLCLLRGPYYRSWCALHSACWCLVLHYHNFLPHVTRNKTEGHVR